MQIAIRMMLGLAVVMVTLVVARAEDKPAKEVTLKGEVGCPKCGFKIAKKCGNAIKVKEGDKEVIYTFLDAGAKEPYHKEICTENKPGSVKGVVSKKGDQSFIKPAKGSVKFD